MSLQASLSDALRAIWAARDTQYDDALTGFGLLLSNSPRVTSVRFILAHTPERGPDYLYRQCGIGTELYARMCKGRSAWLGGMEYVPILYGEYLASLIQPIAALQTIRREELGVAALLEARAKGAFGGLPLFLWMNHPSDDERAKRLALQLNDPDTLADWAFGY